MKMDNPDFLVRVLFLEILGYQATMALFRGVFGAKEAALVEVLNTVTLSNPTTLQDVIEDDGVAVPIDDFILVVFEKFLGRGEVRNMDIVSVTNRFHEKLQIRAFSKAGELAGIIDADVDKFFNAGILE